MKIFEESKHINHINIFFQEWGFGDDLHALDRWDHPLKLSSESYLLSSRLFKAANTLEKQLNNVQNSFFESPRISGT